MFFCQVALAVDFQSDSVSEVEEARYLEKEVSSKTPFSEARWNAAKAGTNYVPEEEEKPENVKRKQPVNFNFLPDLSSLKYVFIAFTIIAIIVLVLYNFKSTLFTWVSSKPKTKFVLLESEKLDDQDLLLQDLQKLLSDALAAKEYALAIRLVYLSTLQQLIQHRLIVWKKELPNRNILRQIKVEQVYKDAYPIFKGFEQVWYGQKPVQQLDYDQMNRLYTHFLASLTAKH